MGVRIGVVIDTMNLTTRLMIGDHMRPYGYGIEFGVIDLLSRLVILMFL